MDHGYNAVHDRTYERFGASGRRVATLLYIAAALLACGHPVDEVISPVGVWHVDPDEISRLLVEMRQTARGASQEIEKVLESYPRVWLEWNPKVGESLSDEELEAAFRKDLSSEYLVFAKDGSVILRHGANRESMGSWTRAGSANDIAVSFKPPLNGIAPVTIEASISARELVLKHGRTRDSNPATRLTICRWKRM